MEPEVREFLVKIMQSISMGMVWLLVNMSIGIYYGYAFFEESPTMGNYFYWIAFLASLVALILYLKKKWKGWEEKNYDRF